MEMLSSWLGKKKPEEPMKPVVDPATIVEPVDFFGPDFPYEQGFKEMDAYIRTLPAKGYVPVSDILRLQFYALYKQATLGDIEDNVKQPSMFRDWEGYWKVVGWRKCKGMPKERARDYYIELFDAQVRKHSKVKWGATLAEDRWAAFYDGVQRIQNLPKNGYHIPDSFRAHVYAVFKQATVGDLKAFQKSEASQASKYKWLRARPTKPGFDQWRYDEWKKLDGMSKEHAKRLYCKEIFHEGAKYGYVWDPPGTEGHLEVIGDQTSAKNFKRMDSDALKKRQGVVRPSTAAETPVEEIEGTGVKLSALERVALKKFLEKERKELDKKANDPNQKVASTQAVAAEALEIYKPERAETDSTMSELHIDPNEVGETAAVDPTAEPAKTTSAEINAEVEENGESSSAEEEKPVATSTAAPTPAKGSTASVEASTSATAPTTKSPAPTKTTAEPSKTAKTSTLKATAPAKKKSAAVGTKGARKSVK